MCSQSRKERRVLFEFLVLGLLRGCEKDDKVMRDASREHPVQALATRALSGYAASEWFFARRCYREPMKKETRFNGWS